MPGPVWPTTCGSSYAHSAILKESLKGSLSLSFSVCSAWPCVAHDLWQLLCSHSAILKERLPLGFSACSAWPCVVQGLEAPLSLLQSTAPLAAQLEHARTSTFREGKRCRPCSAATRAHMRSALLHAHTLMRAHTLACTHS